MAKITVFEAAKRLEIEPSEFQKKLRELGINAEDFQATIDTGDLPRVQALMNDEGGEGDKAFTERRVGTTVIRRRARRGQPADEPEEAIETTAAAEEAEESAEASDVSREQPAPPPLVVAEEAPMTEEAPAAAPAPPAAESEDADKVTDSTTMMRRQPAERGGGSRPKVLSLRGRTPEPAKVVARPARPVAPTPSGRREAPFGRRPAAAAETPAAPRPEAAGAAGAERRGRRVVEIGRSRDYASRRKSKELATQESRMESVRRKKREFKQTEITTPKASKRKIRIEGAINVGELAHRMGIKGGDLIKRLFEMGQMVTINQALDVDSATIIAGEYGYEIEDVAIVPESMMESQPDDAVDLKPRHPVVTVMGHVDHGKTTLLDAIRKTNVVGGEAGGITQHVGAYKVRLGERAVAFIDTPGHESFTNMRARGAQVTDIVVLVVAADDGVMPQTIEAINHAKDAGVPIVVAVNKIDKEGANIERIVSQLSEYGLVPETWGGETQYAEVSAKQVVGIDELLEKILLQADVLDLKANPDKKAVGVVLEARLEKGQGPVATVLVSEGTLKVGDPIVAGSFHGRVRFMNDGQSDRMDEAGPGDPVEVVGLGGVPNAGDRFFVTDTEKTAKQIAEALMAKQRELKNRRMTKVSLENLFDQIKEEAIRELKVILKGDVHGSVEAVTESLGKLATEQVKVNVVHSGVGGITETDINFAVASNAVIIGFNVKPSQDMRDLASREGIQIKSYSVIYELIDDVTKAMEGLLAPIREETIRGHAEVRAVFPISRLGTIAGCYITDGQALRNANVRVLRDGQTLFTGKMASLKRFKDDVREVQTGFECGIQVDGFNDLREGDVIEIFTVEEVAAKLSRVVSS